MRPVAGLALLLVLGVVGVSSDTFGNDGIAAKARWLSERVLVLTGLPSTCQVTALATEAGIVVVDTGISHGVGAVFRETIERELGRDDFTFVINTHGHRDHTVGNGGRSCVCTS